MSYIKQEHPEYYMDPKNIPPSNLGDGNQGDHTQTSVQSSQNSITAFLAKLWALVNDPSNDDLISWDPSGASFHVYDQSRFSREILPRYFKHNNFASFIRQLNMYGFRKMSTIEHGSLANERDDIEFAHPHFIRGQDSLLELIKRRAPDNQQKPTQGATYLDSKTGRPIELSEILNDVRGLQTRQTSLNDKLSYMQTENQALWGEIASLRQKHAKQQQIVSKLMEFLLSFITSNSAPNHAHHHVDQQPHKEGLTVGPHNSQQVHGQPHTLHEQDLSPNTLKRKHAALMHNDEPNKRTTAQQQQFSQPPGLGRQQSVTINELTDNDGGTWLHTNTSPLVDLVPSPPPAQTSDDNYHWPTATNEPGQNPRNPAFQTVGNGDNVANTYVPDFILRTDDPSATQIDGAGVKTSHVNTDNLKISPTLYSQNQQQHKIDDASSGQSSFSLDDITGDVDHIQSSLDNIRDFMFDNLPDEPSIDDLFGEDHGLLSPLLQTTSANKSATNPIQDQKLIPGDYKSDPLESAKTSQSVPNVNDQLLEHLINETALIKEQQHTIDQLEREKSDLEDKIHLLEQQVAHKH